MLHLDLETFSDIDLSRSGIYRYCESPFFEILLLGYCFNDENVKVVDIAGGEAVPADVLDAITDNTIIKSSHNAAFERICLSKWLKIPAGQYLNPESWRCSMVWAAYLGLPLSLAGVGAVLGLEKQKMAEGKDLVRYFCQPCKPTQANGGRSRNRPADAPEKWLQFKTYNARDVETEMAIQARLQNFPVPAEEWQNYILDQTINDRGIGLDLDLVKEAIRFDERAKADLMSAMQTLTEMENPNSVAQMKVWLAENGLETDTLGKAAVKDLIKSAPEPLRQVLELRQSLAKSSVKKYTAMDSAICKDGRARGLLQFYGANRTGRWAGRLIQVQNLPQNHLPDLAQARSLVKSGNFAALEMLYDSVPAVLSELIRTAFVPRPGQQFLVADFSAIEARVIAWLAGETWRNEVFASHGKIYEASASQMFHVPIEEITKGSPLRQKGKIAELALGYGGSVGALKAMGAIEMGVTEEELRPLVAAWRTANPNIVRLWWEVDQAAMTAVKERTTTSTHGLRFACKSGMLFIVLPSGRQLSYVKPRIGENQFGSECVTYEGVGATKRWERIETYGPKLVENIVQAISRDILCYAMRRLAGEGYSLVMSVHDEVVLEVASEASLTTVSQLMADTPPWAKGLLLRADGFVCPFYKKD